MNTPNPPSASPETPLLGPVGVAPSSPFSLERLLTFLLRFWWVPVLTLVLALGAAIGYIRYKPPTFVSRASMWETVKLRLPEGSLFSEDLQNFIGTQTELLQSDRLRQLALDSLRTASNSIALGKDRQPLRVAIRLTQAQKSAVFTLEASSSDPAYAQAYLDALMKAYLQYKAEVRAQVTGFTAGSIETQVGILGTKLKAEQDALTDFQQANNLAILQEQGTIAGSYLARLNTQLSDYQLELQLTTNLQAALEKERAGASNANTSLPVADSMRGTSSASSLGGASDPLNAFKEIAVLQLQRDKLSQFMRPKHPKIVKLDADIQRMQKLLDLSLSQTRAQNSNQLASTRQSLEMKILTLLASITNWQAAVTNSNSLMDRAERLKLNVSQAQSQYDRLNTLLKNIDISRKIEQETLAVLEPASPAIRSYRQEQRLVTMSILGGLFAGLGIVFLVAIRDDRFISLNEVSGKLLENIVGQVPEVPLLGRQGSVPLLEIEDQRHMYAESYRNLRSALLYMPIEGERPKILLITSAMPNEGKSTVAANLARALAFGGAKVLLVDGDLRKGILHDMLGMQREPGLGELLRQPGDLAGVLQTNSLPNFSFLSSGNLSSNCGDLFLGPALDQVFAELRRQFDYVLIDSSPVFASDDVTTLAPKVDGTLFVVRRSYSRARPVKEALDLLYQRQARVLGVIFTRADASARSFYYYKYGGYLPQPKTA